MMIKANNLEIVDPIYGKINMEKNPAFRALFEEVYKPLLETYEVRRSNWLRQAMFLFREFKAGTQFRAFFSVIYSSGKTIF